MMPQASSAMHGNIDSRAYKSSTSGSEGASYRREDVCTGPAVNIELEKN
jgi:hypothetical protein